MIFSQFGFMAAAMLGAFAVEAHMMMSQPTPYSQSTLDNSPLDTNGDNFPCKLRANTYESPATETIAKIGETMPLTFVGSATHGGGSCQISLTTDLQPSKSSTWMVIKSIEGGCPANVARNLNGDGSTPDPYTFNYTIPDGIEPGKYTLAWTWFNRIGNREMYMNCAPITVASGASKRDVTLAKKRAPEKRSANFPAMLVANINNCTTTEGVDIRFPDPGQYVEYDGQPSNLQPSGQSACSGVPAWTVSGGSGTPATASSPDSTSAAVSGAGTSTATSQPTSPSTTQSVSTSQSTSQSTPTSQTAPAPVIFAPTSSSVDSGATVPTQSVIPIATGSSPSSSTSDSSSSSSGALSGSCSTEGLWNCIGGSAFQRCADGQWSVSQQMAPGTQCTAGQTQDLAISATNLKPRFMNSMRVRRRSYARHV